MGRSVPEEVAKGLLSWYWTRPPDIGITTRAVLSHTKSPGTMYQASRAHGKRQAALPKIKGYDPGVANGSLMRTGPVCLPYLGDRRKVALAARQISDLTHFDPDGYTGDACVIWSLFIEEAVTTGCASFYAGLEFVDAERRDYWRAVIKGVFAEGSVPPVRNGGVVGAFKAALWAVSRADSLEDGLQRAVSHRWRHRHGGRHRGQPAGRHLWRQCGPGRMALRAARLAGDVRGGPGAAGAGRGRAGLIRLPAHG